MIPTPIEAAARGLCLLDGHPEAIQFEGASMWHSYLPEARAVLEAARDIAPAGVDAAAWRVMMDAAIATGDER